jgi:hypothetical protein
MNPLVTNKGKFNRIFDDSINGIDDCEKRVQTETKKEDDYENLLNSEDSNNPLFEEQLTMKLKPI